MTILTTDRLILRPMREADFAPLCALWANVEFVRAITGQALNAETVWLRLLRDIGHWQVFGFGNWAVTLKNEGIFIGSAGVFDYRRDLSPPFDAPEAGWGIEPAFHGQGYAREAMAAVLDHADRELKLARTACMISSGNEASLKLAARLGFVLWRDGLYRGEPIQLFERSAGGGDGAKI
jgi:RimJ/RimL family protein N-acetyltransferase